VLDAHRPDRVERRVGCESKFDLGFGRGLDVNDSSTDVDDSVDVVC
jgi:hypothetical protein